MKSDFCLSDKIGIYNSHEVILTGHVKEFIKRLKEYIESNINLNNMLLIKPEDIVNEIDKLAGERL